MKTKWFLFIGVVVFIASCKNDVTLPQPKADFSLDGTPNSPMVIIGTHDALYPINNSTNFESFVWDFGNGTTSTDAHPKVTYDAPGHYSVSLTVFQKDGSKNSITKQVTVKERVVKALSIDKISLNKFSPIQSGLPVFTKLDLWVELKFSQAALQWTSNNDVNAPTIYTSPVFSDIDSSYHSSLNYYIPSTEKLVINYPVSDGDFIKGPGLIANLYGKDSSGTYLLFSSAWTGFGFIYDPSNSNYFGLELVVPSSGTKLKFDCEFQ